MLGDRIMNIEDVNEGLDEIVNDGLFENVIAFLSGHVVDHVNAVG